VSDRLVKVGQSGRQKMVGGRESGGIRQAGENVGDVKQQKNEWWPKGKL